MATTPLTIDADEALGRAVQRRAASCGISSSDVVNAILRKALDAELAEMSGVPPLAVVLQDLHHHWLARQTNGSTRPVGSPAELTNR